MTEHRDQAVVDAPVRRELVTGRPNRIDGARVAVLERWDDRIRVRVLGPVALPGTEAKRPAEELAVGDLLTLTRTWRVISIEPEQPVTSDLPGAGSGQLAAVVELVIP